MSTIRPKRTSTRVERARLRLRFATQSTETHQLKAAMPRTMSFKVAWVKVTLSFSPAKKENRARTPVSMLQRSHTRHEVQALSSSRIRRPSEWQTGAELSERTRHVLLGDGILAGLFNRALGLSLPLPHCVAVRRAWIVVVSILYPGFLIGHGHMRDESTRSTYSSAIPLARVGSAAISPAAPV